MMVEEFREEMRLLALKPGDAVCISYRAGASERSIRGDYLGIDHERRGQRVELLDFDGCEEIWIETDQGMECKREPKVKSVSVRNIIRIDSYDWTNGIASCDEIDKAAEYDL